MTSLHQEAETAVREIVHSADIPPSVADRWADLIRRLAAALPVDSIVPVEEWESAVADLRYWGNALGNLEYPIGKSSLDHIALLIADAHCPPPSTETGT